MKYSNQIIRIIVVIVFCLPSMMIDLSAQLEVSAEIRPRTEYRHGFKTLFTSEEEAAFFTDQRTRLNFDFKSTDVQAYLSLHDIRVWGNQPQLVIGDGNLTGIHQAWAKLNLGASLDLKFGRQEIIYDDHRIFGNVGWAQQARSHDAAILMFQDSSFQAHVGLAFNQNDASLSSTLYTIPNNYKAMQYLWLHNEWKNFSGSFLFLNNGQQVIPTTGDARTNYSQTIGLRAQWKKDKWGGYAALYYQGGKQNDINDTKINAYYTSLGFHYTTSEMVTLKAGFEIISGNDQLNVNNENNAFAPLYGTNHKFNGFMDYFYVGNHGNNVGLDDLYIGTSIGKTTTTNITAHLFYANGSMDLNNNDDLGQYLGLEMDIDFSFKINASANGKIGYSQLFATESMETIKGGDSTIVNNWIWAMVVVQPKFKIANK